MNQHRRRLDTVLADDFGSISADVHIDELRRRRDLAEEVEHQLSYYRRLLHGRMDLLAFELRRRRGEENRTVIEALPDILAAGLVGAGGSGRHVKIEMDLPLQTGKRQIDRVLEDDALARISSMSEDEIVEVQAGLADAEEEISRQRRQVHAVIDPLQSEIIDRYKRGLAGSSRPG